MTSNEWQDRVLADDELQRVLANLGALEGMEVLQRQLELRSSQHEPTGDLRKEVLNHLELGLTDFVPVVSEPVLTPELAPVKNPEPEQNPEPEEESNTEPAAPSHQPAAPSDIAGNLNALFASRQKVEFDAPPALEIKPVEHKLDYAPIPLASDTTSFFIPTFANPLPDTQSVEVVTPMLAPEALAKASPRTVESASAEELVTEFEVLETTSTPQPDLVDEIIRSVSEPEAEQFTEAKAAPQAEPSASPVPDLTESVADVDVDLPDTADLIIAPVNVEPQTPGEIWEVPATENPATENPATQTSGDKLAENRGTKKAAKAPEGTGKSGFGVLISTWNGTGSLLMLMAAGFTAAQQGVNLVTVLLGAFGALVATGFGFGTAAISARRGRQPQATISRAAFGVRGAAVPLSFVILARYVVTSLAVVAAAVAVLSYLPNVPESVSVAGSKISLFFLVAGILLIVATVLTVLGSAARFAVTAAVGAVSVVWALVTIAAAASLHPAAYSLGGVLNSGQALTFASALFILISVVWGTTATDETPLLRSNIPAPQLLATGVLSQVIFGLLAVLSGFAYQHIAPVLFSPWVGIGFGLLVILTLSHQIRRTADSFSGFGLSGTRWWVVVASALFVAAFAALAHIFIDGPVLTVWALQLLPVVGIPVVAWLAIFGVDSILRKDDYHELSLLRDYGFYGKVRLANLIGWAVAVILGLGFIGSDVPGFTWLGYIARLLGMTAGSGTAGTGLWVAFAVGLISPLFTIAKIRDQEAEGRALLERHKELANVLGEL
jgi:hypothetical protein